MFLLRSNWPLFRPYKAALNPEPSIQEPRTRIEAVDKIKKLEEILKSVGPQNIWHPVVVNGDKLLANGIGDPLDGIRDHDGVLDFKGKTVVDLGCNFGHYCFFVRNAGARDVLGIDMDERIVRGCEILKALHDVDRVNFRSLDIMKANGIGKFDIGMMIDIIGRDKIRTGTAKDLLNSLERLSQKEMLLTLRPRYHIEKKLGTDVQKIREMYPADYIRNPYFYMVDYVRDRFKEAWVMHLLSGQTDPEGTKQSLHFIRKNRQREDKT
jgi:SAM-dependent methyltransferase